MSTWRLPQPGPVREVENDRIVTPDGVRLAVSLWIPDVAGPSPVVLESTPYRKRDSSRAYSLYWGRLLAQHGVAYARLDARGSGDSEGVIVDEYLPQEQQDAASAIAWLAAQPWCNGNVGMRGVSWGGFATLQAAALAPPALKAIMCLCASDRRFTDDAHYVGGAFALTGLKWATAFKLVMAGPPDPAVFGPGWEAAWRERLESAPPIASQWLGHQREDAYWRQGSVGFHPERIDCPTYLVGGWADPYNAAIPRLMEALTVPTKAVIGTWGHGYPQPAAPGPGLRWIEEEVRWWRHWLAGEDTLVMQGPRLWAYMPEASPAEVAPGSIPGRWVAEPAWPPATEPLSLSLAPGRLSQTPGEAAMVELASDPRVGTQTPEWCPFSPAQYPQEQSSDDALSLTFDGELLAAPFEILGEPVLRLRLSADRPVAKLAARLTEVRPDGRSWLVTYAVLNLTHRDNHAAPEPLDPGRFYDIELALYPIARRFAAGSRIRLALSESLWPLIWPSPQQVTLRLDLADATLMLPVRFGGEEPVFPIALDVRERGAGRGVEPLVMGRVHPDESVTLSDGRLVRIPASVTFSETSAPSHTLIEATGVTVSRAGPDLQLHASVADPESCSWRVRQYVGYRRGDWFCELRCEVEVGASRDAFHVREALTASRNGAVIFSREKSSDIPRDLM